MWSGETVAEWENDCGVGKRLLPILDGFTAVLCAALQAGLELEGRALRITKVKGALGKAQLLQGSASALTTKFNRGVLREAV